MWLLLILFLPVVRGSPALMAVSDAVSGPVRGSLTVQCLYEPGWETYNKWWCQGAEWKSCRILVQTDGSEREARGDRVSIKDNQKLRVFTVTMEELRWNNADTYWCGIERSGPDLGVKVKVTIDPVTEQCHYSPGWETFMKSWCPDADLDTCTIFVETTGSEFKHTSSSFSIHHGGTQASGSRHILVWD
ncbi:CMRF35-like molecule 7 isoform X1 [Canis lupus familiaris]|uniref:CMRF35-like molecule 7 isoform X1 n=1 Tax=Canis lupus familiaris TaxID=9615 RepID=UPI0018F315EC|nr:CMRF35-like molecule 7 isoform X1 [Canis lupus familiaris]